jgi:hypothetical protein
MRCTVVQSSELKCWNPLRYLDACEDCDRVERCKYGRPPMHGRLALAVKQMYGAEDALTEAQKRVARLQQEIDTLKVGEDGKAAQADAARETFGDEVAELVDLGILPDDIGSK